MTWRTSLSIAVMTGILLATPAIASADNVGAQGRVLALRLTMSVSDDYGIDHGAVVIGDSIGGTQTYHWGGSRCPVVEIDDAKFAMLQRALDNPRILVEPGWKQGQGGFACLVRFTFFLRSEQALILP